MKLFLPIEHLNDKLRMLCRIVLEVEVAKIVLWSELWQESADGDVVEYPVQALELYLRQGTEEG